MTRRSWVSLLALTLLGGGWLAGFLGIPVLVQDGVWPWDQVVESLVGAEQWVHHLQTRALPLVATVPISLLVFWLFSRVQWLRPGGENRITPWLRIPSGLVFLLLLIFHLGLAMIQGNSKPIGWLSSWGDRATTKITVEQAMAQRGQPTFLSDAWLVLFDRDQEKQSDYRELLKAYLEEGGTDLDYRLDMAAWQAGQGNYRGAGAWVQPDLPGEVWFWTALVDPSVVVSGRAQQFPGLVPRLALEEAHLLWLGKKDGVGKSLEIAEGGRNPGDACLRAALWHAIGETERAQEILSDPWLTKWMGGAKTGYLGWWQARSPRETALWTASWSRLALGLRLAGDEKAAKEVWDYTKKYAALEDMPYLALRFEPLWQALDFKGDIAETEPQE